MDTAIEYLNNVSIMALTFFDYIQQTHQMAFTDSLTELGNRNAYETSCVRMAHDFDSVRSLCLTLFALNGRKRVHVT